MDTHPHDFQLRNERIRNQIAQAHAAGKRVSATYFDRHGSLVKGLVLDDATHGRGEHASRYFLYVNNFATRIALDDVREIRVIERK